MKRNIALFTLLIVGLGAVSSTLPKKWGGHHGRHHGHGWRGRGWDGSGVSFGIGFGGGPYGYGPRTVVIEKEVQGAPSSFSHWNITNNTSDTIQVTTNADEAFIRPGQTISVNRGNSYKFRVDGKSHKSYKQNIEIN